MAAVLKSGSSAGAVDFGYHTSTVKLLNTAGTEATVKLNEHTVTLPASMVNYEDFHVDASSMEVLTGTVHYVAIG